jgi:hypothetical protein
MSNQYYEQLLETTLTKVQAMSFDEFQNACEEYLIECHHLDSIAQELTYRIVEARSE